MTTSPRFGAADAATCADRKQAWREEARRAAALIFLTVSMV